MRESGQDDIENLIFWPCNERERDGNVRNGDVRVYGSLVLSLCNARKLELAAEFYKKMALDGMKLDGHGYKLLLTYLGEAGDIFTVRSVGNERLKISGIPKCVVNSSMMQSFSISGRFGDAIKSVNEFRRENLSLEELLRVEEKLKISPYPLFP
ncbi:hypothetical protein AMTR_s00008p00240220 [Amborella trichopoda]|uniref:Pentatricopeptide repeat-containing protein n=1 Tax=Amborella trichopoda TaxID=13333 RepID=W1NJQ8_AMBTC|nr:hypothetical protein AMTR_s00008p00240220 [Amborella trichopoda]